MTTAYYLLKLGESNTNICGKESNLQTTKMNTNPSLSNKDLVISETLAFSGERDGYQRWLQRATPFLQAKDVWDVISSDRVASKVISSEEKMLGYVTEIVSNENGISVEMEVPVTKIQEKLYKLDRAAVVFLNSMFEKVDSVFLRFKPEMKAHEMWRIIKEEYETESTNKIQSASEWEEQMNLISASDFEKGEHLTTRIETINDMLQQVGQGYSDVKLLTKLYNLIPDNKNGVHSWSQFKNTWRGSKLEEATYDEMKRDFHDYWRLNGAPMGNGKAVKAAYNASLVSARKSDKECNFCGKSGHLEEQCWKKKNQERFNTNKGSGDKTSKGKGEATETTKCFKCNKMGHFAFACPKKKKNQQEGVSAKAVSFLTQAIDKGECANYKCSGFEIEPPKPKTKPLLQGPPYKYWWADACESDDESVHSDSLPEGLDDDGDDEFTNAQVCGGSSSLQPVKELPVETLPMNASLDEHVQALHADTHVMQQGLDSNQWETWILDSGASGHFTNNDHMMINKRRTSVPTNVANGPGQNTEVIGDLPLRSIENNMDFCLTSVHLQESFGRNLMSMPVLLERGCNVVKICSEEIIIDGPTPSNCAIKPIRLIFRRGEDKLYYLHVKRTSGPVHKALSASLMPQDSEVYDAKRQGLKQKTLVEAAAVEKTRKLRSINIMVAHELLGHPGEKKVCETAKVNGWKLLGVWRACEWCDQAKARQKNIAKVSERKTSHPGEMLHLDLTGPFKTTPSNSRFALLIVDDFTDRKWIYLLQRKSQVVDEVEGLIVWLKGRNIICKCIRMDGGGENLPIRKLCDLHGIVAEYTARDTPQQNGKVERAIATLKDRATADILRLKCDEKWWGANMIHKTVCDNMMPRKGFSNGYEPFGERPPVKDNDLVPFGAQGVMAKRQKLKKNWTAKGEEVFMVGYTEDAPSDCYNVVKKSNGRVVASRDIKWSNPYWKTSNDGANAEKARLPTTDRPPTSEKHVDFVIPDDYDSDDSPINDDEYKPVVVDDPGTNSSEGGSMNPSLQSGGIGSILADDNDDDDSFDDVGHVVKTKPKSRELQRLEWGMRDGNRDNQWRTMNPKAQRELKRLQWGFHANAVQINNDPGTPKNMREALKGPEAEQWRNGLFEEYDNFLKKRSAWKFQKLPKGKRVIGTKNVLKKTFNDPKANGGTRYKLRNVLLGYQQIPGVDFSESHSPTPRDSSIRLVLALALYFGDKYEEELLEEGDEWVYTNVIDVEAAFLESKLAFPMYIKFPEYFMEYCEARGVEIPEDADCLEVGTSQYGSCPASRDWFNLAVEIYTGKGNGRVELQQSVSDPCIFYKRDAKGRVVLIGSNWVDDSVWSGKRSEIELLKKTMRERVTISDLGPIETHLGVDYKLCEDEDGKYFECSMESYLCDAVKKFEEFTGKEVRNYATPGRAHICLEKYDGEPVNQEDYRSHVGKILFAIKKVLPDCANAIRDLSSHLQCPSKEHWLALARLFGYIKHRRRPFKLRKPKELRVVGCSDSDWAGDKSDRHSVTSNITTIGGNSVTEVISKKQTTIATSSAHAETVAGSTLAMEMKAQNILLGEIIGKDPEYPSVMYVDNKAVLFNAENHHVGTGLKHIEIRDRYMLGQTRPREDDGVVELNVRYIYFLNWRSTYKRFI